MYMHSAGKIPELNLDILENLEIRDYIINKKFVYSFVPSINKLYEQF